MSKIILDETSAKAFRAAKFRHLFLIGTIAFIILVCVSVFIYQNKQKKHLEKLAKEYAQIESLYYQENQQVQNSVSKIQQDKNQIENHAKSMAQFHQFALKYANDPYGWQSAIRAANYDINYGNIQAAKELFETIIPYTYNFSLIQIKMGLALAEIYASEQNYDKALERIEYIEKIYNNPILEETKLLHAQILYKADKKQDASQILNQLNTPQANLWIHYFEL